MNVGLGGLALQEVGRGEKVGMAPKNDKGRNSEGVAGEDMMEEVKSNTSMDKVSKVSGGAAKVNKGFGGSAKASNTGAVSAKKSSLVENGKEEEEAEVAKVEGKKRAPSICSCEYEFYHSRNLHAKSSMERQKK